MTDTDASSYTDEHRWLGPAIEALGFEQDDQGRTWTNYTDGDLHLEVFWREPFPPLMWLEANGTTTKFYDFSELKARVETIRGRRVAA